MVMVAKVFTFVLASIAAVGSAEVDSPAWACPLSGESSLARTSDDTLLRLHVDKEGLGNNASVGFIGKHEVPDLDHASLSKVIQDGGVDNIVAFWAPWCPHCKTLCIADQHGNFTNAPLEVLNRQLVAENGPKVSKFNVQASPLPSLFKVKYIPAVYILTKGGLAVPFKGDPHDIQSVRSFAYETSGKNVPAASFAAKKVSLHRRM